MQVRLLLGVLIVLILAAIVVPMTGGPQAQQTVSAQPLDAIPWISVRAFGARGDGKTDDTAALRAGIAAAMESGQTLFFPKGTYMVSDTIRIDTWGFRMEGSGPAHTTIRAAAEMERLLYVRGASIVISRMTLDGNNLARYALHAFDFNEQDSVLEFLRVQGAKSHGIFLDHSQVSEVRNCVSSDNGGDGFYISDCNGIRIVCCRGISNRGRGFTVTATDYSGGCWLLECDAEANTLENVLISAHGGTPVVIRRLWAEGNAHPDNAWDGVRIASPQVVLSESRISTRANDLVRPKWVVHLAADMLLMLAPESVAGEFVPNETVTGEQSGATGLVSFWQASVVWTKEFPIPKPYERWLERPKKLVLMDVSGTFQEGDTVTGQTSGAQGSVVSASIVSARNCVVADNSLARETVGASVDRIHVDAGCESIYIRENYRMWGPGLIPVEIPEGVAGDPQQ